MSKLINYLSKDTVELFKDSGFIRKLRQYINSSPSGSSGIDDTLALGQALTANREIDVTGQSLTLSGDSGAAITIDDTTNNVTISGSLITLNTGQSIRPDVIFNRIVSKVADNTLSEDAEYFIRPTPITTTDNTPTALYTFTVSDVIPLDGDTMRLTASVLSKSGANRAWMKVTALIKNISGTITVIGSAQDFTAIRDGALSAINVVVLTNGSTTISVNFVGVTASVISSGEITYRIN